MPFCYSINEEYFSGAFDSTNDAIAAAIAETKDGDSFWIGECRSPTQPEDFWCAEDWLEHVSVQDDYSGEFASDWDLSSEKQRQELEVLVRGVLKDWLDRHNLRPTHYYVDNAVRYRNLGGGAIRDIPLSEMLE